MKLKTHKGLMKRIKITATGKIKHKRRGTSHLMSSWSGKRARQARNKTVVSGPIAKMLERMVRLHLRGRD